VLIERRRCERGVARERARALGRQRIAGDEAERHARAVLDHARGRGCTRAHGAHRFGATVHDDRIGLLERRFLGFAAATGPVRDRYTRRELGIDAPERAREEHRQDRIVRAALSQHRRFDEQAPHERHD
jgi:hypothetical protein